MRLFRSDKHFISITREVWHERDGSFVLRDDPRAGLLFGSDDVLEKHATCFREILPADTSLGFDSLEDKVRRIDLAVRMWIRDADDFAFVLEDEHVVDIREATERVILFLPDVQQLLNLSKVELSEREVVFRTVANDARDAASRTILIETRRRFKHRRRRRRHTRMIVIENVSLLVLRIDRAADARVSGTEITIRHIRR